MLLQQQILANVTLAMIVRVFNKNIKYIIYSQLLLLQQQILANVMLAMIVQAVNAKILVPVLNLAVKIR